jgi:hypothetical protein
MAGDFLGSLGDSKARLIAGSISISKTKLDHDRGIQFKHV